MSYTVSELLKAQICSWGTDLVKKTQVGSFLQLGLEYCFFGGVVVVQLVLCPGLLLNRVEFHMSFIPVMNNNSRVFVPLFEKSNGWNGNTPWSSQKTTVVTIDKLV